MDGNPKDAQTYLDKNFKQALSSSQVYFRAEFYGPLDLTIMENHKVKRIFFSPGGISGLTHLPEGLREFYCAKNLLETLENIPTSVTELHLDNNLLKGVDLKRLDKLKVLRISHNKITSLDLPDSLEELYCEDNQITKLNLKNTIKLRILHCRGNGGLEIENVPVSLVETEFPPQVKIKFLVHQNENSKEYQGYVLKYFDIKKKYELKLKELRRGKSKRFPLCLGCKKAVGMVFSSKNGKYAAHCNSPTPCKWQILIHRGYNENEVDLLYSYYENVEDYKENVIKQKLNTLFEYIPEKESAVLFEKQLKAYQTDSALFKTHLDNYQEKYFSAKKRELALTTSKIVQEKLLSLKGLDREAVVNVLYNEIHPLVQHVRLTTYENSEVLTKWNESDLKDISRPDDIYANVVHVLCQYEVDKGNIGVSVGEKPAVVRFS